MMENKEEVLNVLEEFGRLPGGTVPTVLEEYLSRIAVTGATLFPWSKVKPLLLYKLDIVLKEFQERAPLIHPTHCPNVDDVKFEEMHKRLILALDQFTGTPFTIQRLCELLTFPMKHYKKVDKFMRGIEKNLTVVTTVDSFGNRIVSESKTLVNGLDTDAELSVADRAAADLSFIDQSASPFVPTAPMNSPANMSGNSGGSWFSSLTSVVDSPSSYPNWRGTANAAVSPSMTSGTTSSDGSSWSAVLAFEADDVDDEPPPKRRFVAQPSEQGNSPVVVVTAPLLGQLLSSSSDSCADANAPNGDHHLATDADDDDNFIDVKETEQEPLTADNVSEEKTSTTELTDYSSCDLANESSASSTDMSSSSSSCSVSANSSISTAASENSNSSSDSLTSDVKEDDPDLCSDATVAESAPEESSYAFKPRSEKLLAAESDTTKSAETPLDSSVTLVSSDANDSLTDEYMTLKGTDIVSLPDVGSIELPGTAVESSHCSLARNDADDHPADNNSYSDSVKLDIPCPEQVDLVCKNFSAELLTVPELPMDST
jgi:serine/threonine-protein phosphatase 4 regulatory subunit 2